MPRRPRIHLDNAFYHATLRGNHREPVFAVDNDRRLLGAIVERAIAAHGAKIHAFCWMTNHLHFLVQVGTAPLGDVMRHIASNYARAFQLKMETSGHLFERRYFARMVNTDSYLLELLRYIHLNPVRAKLVERASDYRWSSHHAYAGGGTEPWLTVDFGLALFAAGRAAAHAAYRDFIAQGDPDWTPADDQQELTSTRMTVAPPPRGGSPLGVHPRQTLDELMVEACTRYGVCIDELLSFSRARAVVLARGWIGREAVRRRVAPLAEVSRVLGKDRSTLRHAMGLLDGCGPGAPP